MHMANQGKINYWKSSLKSQFRMFVKDTNIDKRGLYIGTGTVEMINLKALHEQTSPCHTIDTAELAKGRRQCRHLREALDRCRFGC